MSTLLAEYTVIHVAFLTCLLVLPLCVYNTDDEAEPCSEDLCDLWGREITPWILPQQYPRIEGKWHRWQLLEPNSLSSGIFRSLVSYIDRPIVLYVGETWIWLRGFIVCPVTSRNSGNITGWNSSRKDSLFLETVTQNFMVTLANWLWQVAIKHPYVSIRACTATRKLSGSD